MTIHSFSIPRNEFYERGFVCITSTRFLDLCDDQLNSEAHEKVSRLLVSEEEAKLRPDLPIVTSEIEHPYAAMYRQWYTGQAT